jgi:hypothetical protein
MVLVALHESFDDFPVGEARHLFRMLVDVYHISIFIY